LWALRVMREARSGLFAELAHEGKIATPFEITLVDFSANGMIVRLLNWRPPRNLQAA
jgi:hypothetical protein